MALARAASVRLGAPNSLPVEGNSARGGVKIVTGVRGTGEDGGNGQNPLLHFHGHPPATLILGLPRTSRALWAPTPGGRALGGRQKKFAARQTGGAGAFSVESATRGCMPASARPIAWQSADDGACIVSANVIVSGCVH